MKINGLEKIKSAKIAAIESPACDRHFVLEKLSECWPEREVYFWNKGYKYLHRLVKGKLLTTEFLVNQDKSIFEYVYSLEKIIIIEGFGIIEPESKLAYQIRNFYFAPVKSSLILLNSLFEIPSDLYSLIPKISLTIPNVKEISELLLERKVQNLNPAQLLGLYYGEIDSFIRQQLPEEAIISYKTGKLASKGLKITPSPDVPKVGGLDLLLRDLNKIKKLFSAEAKERGLSPPKGCLLWGLPGTGKSLVAKMLSQIMGVPLISCDWITLIASDLSESMQNLDLVLRLVDESGSCVLFFDEFEKAFHGWDANSQGGVLSKLAGKLLSWLQDHTSSTIMVATINRLELLPPELIRRFQYIWFFDSKLHNGGMYEIFQLHLAKHFPGLGSQFTDDDWYKLFGEYRLCSPAEIAGAIQRVHDEIFYLDLHLNLTPNFLLEQLLIERTKFKPAISHKSISDALARIRQDADFARPVRGIDRSRFAVPQRGLFEEKKSQLPEDYTTAI